MNGGDIVTFDTIFEELQKTSKIDAEIEREIKKFIGVFLYAPVDVEVYGDDEYREIRLSQRKGCYDVTIRKYY